MDGNKIILVGGGTRSGKSSFALSLARRLGKRRLFLATGRAGDGEMGERIRKHRQERGGDFTTVEEGHAVPEAIRRQTDHDVLVLDSLTFWLANLLLDDKAPEVIERQVEDLVAALALRAFHVVIVTDEVGLGIVPESALGRRFRDVAGLAHQRLSRLADEVYLAVLGVILRIKPTLAMVSGEETCS